MRALLLAIIFTWIWVDVSGQSSLKRSTADSVATVMPIRTFISTPSTGKAIIAPDFYAQQLGFFCKQELKLEKAHVPVIFRLGSASYCNMLEQKPGYKQ
jgi:hypothetical protein